MNRENISASLEKMLNEVRVIDPHCHLDPGHPVAVSFDRVLLYHHVWIELVAAGMDPYAVSKAGLPHEGPDPEMDPFERVRNTLPWLSYIENTTIGFFILNILNDIYHVDNITKENYEQIVEDSLLKADDSRFRDWLIKDLAGIDYSISVETGGAPYAPSMLLGKELAPVRLQNGKQTPGEVIREWESAFDRSIRNARDYCDFLSWSAGLYSPDTYRFIGCWVHPAMNRTFIRDKEIDVIIEKARQSRPIMDEELGSFSYYGMRHYLQQLSNRGLHTVQVLVGGDALLPHRAVTAWSPYFSTGMAALANEFEELEFNLSAASDLYTQDLGVLGRHYPNISVAGYWWHTLFPGYIRKSLETRLDMIPINKICFFFSDAYTAEWSYPKLRMVKNILADILTDRIEEGRYTVDLAERIIIQGFYENPKRIYGVRD